MKWKITILSFLLARTSTFCWTTTLRSTSRSRPTQIPRRPIAGAMRLTRLGWTSGPLTGAMRLMRLGWTSGPLTGAMRLMRLGWTSGLVTGTATFRMWTWASGLTLGINAGIPMAGAIRLGRPIAGATRLGGTSGGQAWTTFRMVRASSTSPSTSWPGASRFLRKSHIAIYLLEKKDFFCKWDESYIFVREERIFFVNETKVIYLLEKKEFFFVNETKVWNFWNRKKSVLLYLSKSYFILFELFLTNKSINYNRFIKYTLCYLVILLNILYAI